MRFFFIGLLKVIDTLSPVMLIKILDLSFVVLAAYISASILCSCQTEYQQLLPNSSVGVVFSPISPMIGVINCDLCTCNGSCPRGPASTRSRAREVPGPRGPRSTKSQVREHRLSGTATSTWRHYHVTNRAGQSDYH